MIYEFIIRSRWYILKGSASHVRARLQAEDEWSLAEQNDLQLVLDVLESDLRRDLVLPQYMHNHHLHNVHGVSLACKHYVNNIICTAPPQPKPFYPNIIGPL